MSPKLKLALICRYSDRGFALPIAISLGFIILLVVATLLMRSQDDQMTALAQKSTSQGLSAAETGVTRYQSLINKNRVIAMYSRTGTPGWTTASGIPDIDTCTGGGASQVTAAATTDWRDVDSSDSSKGQYRLIDYTYSPTQGVLPGTGVLTIEGRVNQVGTSSTATSGVGTATTRLQVNIPVINQPSGASPAPALLIQNFTQNMGGNKVKGDIVVAGCSVPSGVSSSNTVSGNAPITKPDLAFPKTPTLPTSNLNTVSPSDVLGTNLPRKNASGVVTDQAQPDGSYHYLIQGNLAGNGSGANITLGTGAKVVFYVQGKIDIGGSPDINKNGYPKNLQIYGNTFQRNADDTVKLDASNKPLTKYGCSAGITLPTLTPPVSDSAISPPSYTVNCPTVSVSLNGGGSIQALVHAPDATGNVAGSGGGCNTSADPPTGGGFIGAVWIKTWDKQSNNAGPMVCAYGNYSDYLSFQQTTQPSIPAISSWQREEIP
ncbi:hypothetical protein [Chroococcidiopsis cubana]|nr:hypothetical protein [Chroococcidiopsis cubana]